MTTATPPDLSPAQLDAILAYLPIFAQPGFVFGAWHTPEGQFPFWTASHEVRAFLTVLHHEQFITPFDWVNWAKEAQRYRTGGDTALATADLTTLRKLLTAYVRADRFAEGTLAARFEEGHITAILRRLQQIRATSAPAVEDEA